MNTKKDCWLCGRGYGLENGGLSPGELHKDFFGDLVCLDCEGRISFTSELLAHPELIPLASEIHKLPHVDGYVVGLRKESENR